MSEVAETNVREAFTCDNDMKAEWCLQKIRRIQSEYDREVEELDRQMQFYVDRKEMLKQKADEDKEFFKGILKGYFDQRADDGFTKATKTKVVYKLPTGDLILKHREPEYEYKKEQKKAIEFLEKNDLQRFVKTKKELNWSDLKPLTVVNGNSVAIKETGEVIPGITATERDDEFEVEVK